LDGASVKDRFPLKEDKVNDYVAGEYTPEHIVEQMRNKGVTDEETINSVNFIATGVQTSMKEKNLRPICRIFYDRTAFQLPGDQKLRISLDSDMTYIREDDLDGVQRRENNNWRRTDAKIDYPFTNLPQKDVYRFPYAVLETKLQTHLGQEPPHWLTTLLESHLVHEVPRFSKYLHGASYFYQDRLPLLPWWLTEMTTDIRKPRSMNAGLSRSKSFKPLIDGQYRHAMEEEERRMELQDRAAKSVAISDISSLTGSTANSQPPMPNGDFNSTDNRRPSKVSSAPTETVVADGNRSSGPIKSNRDEKTMLYRGGTTPLQIENVGQSVAIDIVDDNGKGKEAGKRKIKVKVEPKVFFANERTFISWLQFCALLLTVALNLLNFGDFVSRISGGIFIAIAAIMAIYALYRFERRAWMINRQHTGRYDDLWGPAVLCVFLVAALVVNFYLRFR
jgi:uncharacterized membrane protein YidH (DUF202 family)